MTRKTKPNVAVVAFVLLVLGRTSSPASDLGRVVKVPPPKQTSDVNEVLKGKVDASVRGAGLRAALGFDYVPDSSKDFALKVTNVTPGSPAWASGLKVGDRIVDVASAAQGTTMHVQRDGKVYKAVVKPQTPGNQSMALSSGASSNNKYSNDPRLKDLAKYQVVILIDQSGSMDTPDCPGSLSRWNWCRAETVNVTGALASKFGSDMTIVPFATDYDVFEHCGIDKVRDIFGAQRPGGGTAPEFAMHDVIEHYFRSRPTKPLLMAVVTDGLPNDVWAVADTIIGTTRRMSIPGQVKITFLQVADDMFARDLLADYDRNLMSYGAKYDIVDYETFPDVMSKGILGALLDSVSGRGSSSEYSVGIGGALAKYSHERSGFQGHRRSTRDAHDDRTNLEDKLIKKYGRW